MRLVTALPYIRHQKGHTLLELVVVVAILGVVFSAASLSLGVGLTTQQARGAAQSWQAAAAWAQTGVLWHGGSTQLESEGGALGVEHSYSLCGGDLAGVAPTARTSANVSRWLDGSRITVRFAGTSGSPDSGGSVFFHALRSRYRVVVRPESGLTARSYSSALP